MTNCNDEIEEKENKDRYIQIRITPSEKEMINKLKEHNSRFTISKFFRHFLHEYYKRTIPEEKKEGLGSFQIG